MIEQHFTTTIWIVYKNKVLVHYHKKFNLWLPVGGHIEPNELPTTCAIREAKEETGLDITLISSKKQNQMPSGGEDLLMPEHIHLHNITPTHKHINLVYIAISDSDKLNPQDGESNEFKWLSLKEIEASTQIKDNEKIFAKEALKIAKKYSK
jgi:8-oxo-dGTP pyrophosphatase MutT (NUDIX family)